MTVWRRPTGPLAPGAVGSLPSPSITTSLGLFDAMVGAETPSAFAVRNVSPLKRTYRGTHASRPSFATTTSTNSCAPRTSDPWERTTLPVDIMDASIGLVASTTGRTPSQFMGTGNGTFGDGPIELQVVDRGPQQDGFTNTLTVPLTESASRGAPSSVTFPAKAMPLGTSPNVDPATGPVGWG
jgi:hypothetical protein